MKSKIFFTLIMVLIMVSFFSGITAKAISFAYRSMSSKFFPPTYPDLRLRECDKYGCGHFGASRDGGTRTHKGQDYLTQPGDEIYAPISGIIRTKPAYASGKHPHLRMVSIEDGSTKVNLMYVSPILKTGDMVSRGEVVGFSQSLQSIYPGIPNHVHVEVQILGQKVDPVPFFEIPVV